MLPTFEDKGGFVKSVLGDWEVDDDRGLHLGLSR